MIAFSILLASLRGPDSPVVGVRRSAYFVGRDPMGHVRVACAACLALLTVSPVLAHHSFATEYDRSKPVSVTGVVRKVEWRNPHIWFYVDVKDARGRMVTWGFSGGPPSFLIRQGIPKDVMKAGDEVKVEGFRARDGSNNASGGRVTFADGRSVFTASAEDTRPN